MAFLRFAQGAVRYGFMIGGAYGGRFVNRPYNIERTAVEPVGAIHESPVQA